MNVEQSTRQETMDGFIITGCKGCDQQITLQTDVFLDALEFGSGKGSGIHTTSEDTADFIQSDLAYADQNINYGGIYCENIAGRQTLYFGNHHPLCLFL